MGDIVPREQLVKTGSKGVGGIVGGAGLFLLRAFTIGSGFSLPGIIIGGLVSVFGLGISSSPKDRMAGMVTTGAGLLTVIASLPIVGGLASALMWIGGAGLLAGGAYNLYKFIKGLKKRG